MTFEFVVYGHPATKGSTKRAKLRDGRYVSVNSHPGGASWEHAVAVAAFNAKKHAPPISGPVHVVAHFFLRRPVRAGDFPRRNDIDKLLRCALDGMQRVLFHNDSQVVQAYVFKSFALEAECATFSVSEAMNGEQEKQGEARYLRIAYPREPRRDVPHGVEPHRAAPQ